MAVERAVPGHRDAIALDGDAGIDLHRIPAEEELNDGHYFAITGLLVKIQHRDPYIKAGRRSMIDRWGATSDTSLHGRA
ncbi:MAG: hypothetical protein IPI01_07935 [Ignavibacteriae bacterium]|nr:hypothetical protein [Ignavibacteriota bacterium]